MNICDTVKGMLFTYPTLYKNPVDALVYLFCSSNEWVNGELSVPGTEYLDTMKDDMPEREESDLECLKSLHTGYKLKDMATLMQRQFIVDNIDDILAAPLINVYFGDDPRGYYFVKSISDYSSAFHFPDDITKDWGMELSRFLDYWLYRLNIEYGVSTGKRGETLHWWPKDVLVARDKILDARKRLHPLLNNGQTFEEHEKEIEDMFKSLDDL